MSITAISKAVADRLNAVLPSGTEECSASEGARLIGFVEVAARTGIWPLLMRHCEKLTGGDKVRAEALFVAARTEADLAPFAAHLVDHALGLSSGTLPIGVIDPPFRPHGGVAWDRMEEFAEGAGRLMFADAWATREEELDRTYPGENLYDIAPETPEEAVLEGARLCGRYEAANGVAIHELFERACIAEYGSREAWEKAEEAYDRNLPDFEHFSNDLAFMAMGAGVSWFDDRKAFPLERVSFEYSEEAGLADPEPADAREMAP